MDRNELRRLEKAAREKDKKYLLEWATQFEDSIRRDVEKFYKNLYTEQLSEGIDNLLIAIAYTIRLSETTHLSKKKLSEFMEDLFITVDMFRRGEYTPIEYKEELEKCGVFFDDYQYRHISNPEKSIFDILNNMEKYKKKEKLNDERGNEISK